MQAALADDKCVVIGLQSTGDARTVEAVAERAVDGELDDFVSGPKVLLSFPPGPLISPQVITSFLCARAWSQVWAQYVAHHI